MQREHASGMAAVSAMDFTRDDLPPLPDGDEALPSESVSGQADDSLSAPENGGARGPIFDDFLGEDSGPPDKDASREPASPASSSQGEPAHDAAPAPSSHGEPRRVRRAPPDEAPSSLLLSDDELLAEEGQSTEEAVQEKPQDERAPLALDHDSQAGPASDAAQVLDSLGEDDSPSSLLLDDSEPTGSEEPADSHREEHRATTPRPAVSAAPPPLAEESDDSLPSLLLVEADETSFTPAEQVGEPPPPVDDLEIKLVPIDDEEAGGEKVGESAAAAEKADPSSSSLLIEEDRDAEPGAAGVEAAAESTPPVEKPADRSDLLVDFGSPPVSGSSDVNGPSALLSDTDPGLAGDATGGASSLLMDSDYKASTGPQTAQPTPAKGRRRRPRRERVRVVPPKRGKKIEWFSNPQACATYCKKHKRPLFIYFTTGDVEQCRTYEEAIRLAELQPFLAPYVCCLADLRHPVAKQAAESLGLPTDRPSMIVLSPKGHEFARILKPEVDWQFVATMLFWTLR